MRWLRQQKGWSDATEEKLLEYQENANGKGRYIVLDLIQRCVRERGGIRKTMNFHYQVIRSFFLHNRYDLPRDKFDVGPGTKPPAQGTLTVDKVRRLVEAAGLRLFLGNPVVSSEYGLRVHAVRWCPQRGQMCHL